VNATNPLARLAALLGDNTFFVPCSWGTKAPLVTYKERPFEETKSDAYKAMFEVQVNIAVYLGKASGGLCAIDFDDDADAATFLMCNPRLATTTRTRATRGAMIWLRIEGPYPASCNPAHRHFEWRADSRLSMIFGRHPAGPDYVFLCDSPPVSLPFGEIVWPESWDLPWRKADDAELRRRFGEPFYFNAKGVMTGINEQYWAGVHALENAMLFEPDEEAFYDYNPNNGLYEIQSVDALRTKISDRMLAASRQANVYDLEKRRSARILSGVIAHLRGLVEQRGAFTGQRGFVHLANGVIVLNGGRLDLQAFSREFRSRNGSPIHFAPHAKCERFLNELVIPAVHAEDIELLQKFAGMFVLGENRAQRLLILDGQAGRGKTQFANVIQGLVGMPNVTQLRTKHLGERFELFRFLKKTLLVGIDVEADFLSTKGAAVLKGLVGGDWFDAERKGATGCFQFQGKLNVVIVSNSRLRVRLQGDVGAWRRRLSIVRYESPPPPKKIPDFGAYLIQTEGSGILNWALLGAQKVLTEIPDEGGDLSLTKRQYQIVDSLLAESDSVRFFLQDRVITNSGQDLTVNELVEAYAAYCPERKWQPMPVTEVHSSLESLMLELFGVTKRHDVQRNGKSARGFSGVSFQ
jgi:P4 family phage/plasmid primase-like protien